MRAGRRGHVVAAYGYHPERSDEAVAVCDTLRKKLAAMTITTGTTSIQITGSFGVSFTATPRSLSEVISAADDALFCAKRDGRNMVRMQLIESD